MITAWRIVKRRRAATAFNGEGARLFGGRWNRRGTPMVYLSDSRALAALEMLVHLDAADFLSGYATIRCDFDESAVESLPLDLLPDGWERQPVPRPIQDLGEEWAGSHRSLALRVPSAVVTAEFNYLLNPLHPAFAGIQIGTPSPFRLDVRLKRPQ